MLFALAALLAQAAVASQWSDLLCVGALAAVASIAVLRTARAGRGGCAGPAWRHWRNLALAALFVVGVGTRERPLELSSSALWDFLGSGDTLHALRVEALLEGQLSTDVGYNIRGTVVDVAPTSSGGLRLAVAVEDVAHNLELPRAATGIVALSIRYAKQRWHTGDRVGFRSRLRRMTSYGNFGEFDWATYNARRGIFVCAYAWRESDVERLDGQRGLVDRVRLALSVACDEVAGQGAAILEALITGDRFGLSASTALALRDAGLSHFLAISGSHMVLVAALAVGLLRWALGCSPSLLASYDVARPAALAGAVAVLAYAAVTGGGVSVARSVLMALASLLALWRGRPGDDLRALGGSAVVLAMALPGVGEEAGFQLSFGAVAVLIAYGRHRRRTAAQDAPSRPEQECESRPRRYLALIREAVHLTVVCCAVTSPIVAQHFHRVSVVAPLSNLFAAPLVSAIVVVGLAALVVEPAWPAAQHLLVLVGARLGDALVFVATSAASLPFASVAVPAPGPVLSVALAALPFAALLTSGGRRGATVAALGAVTAACLALGLHDRFRSDRLDVWFASVGQGDAAVVRLPGGKVAVIDAGPGGRGHMVVEPLLRRLWIGRIDLLVASHLQSDHSGAFPELLEAFEVGEMWIAAGPCQGPEASSLLDKASEYHVPVRRVRAGQSYSATDIEPQLLNNGGPRQVTSAAMLEVLAPAGDTSACDANDQSLVLAATFAGRRLLFTGDIEAPTEEALVGANVALAADLLKVPHHGSRTSSTSLFLDAVAPVTAVVSVGLENHYGFPDRSVEERYLARGVRWLRTDQVGAVHVVVDQGGLTAVTARRCAQP